MIKQRSSQRCGFPHHCAAVQEAESSEKSQPPMVATCRAIVKEVVGHGVEEEDRKRTWMADAGGRAACKRAVADGEGECWEMPTHRPGLEALGSLRRVICKACDLSTAATPATPAPRRGVHAAGLH